jgi:hypothetical protein
MKETRNQIQEERLEMELETQFASRNAVNFSK